MIISFKSSTLDTLVGLNAFKTSPIRSFKVFIFCSLIFSDTIAVKFATESSNASCEIGIAPRYVSTSQLTVSNSGRANSGFFSNSATVLNLALARFKIGYLPDAVETEVFCTNSYKSWTVFTSFSGMYLMSSGIVTPTSSDLTLSRFAPLDFMYCSNANTSSFVSGF